MTTKQCEVLALDVMELQGDEGGYLGVRYDFHKANVKHELWAIRILFHPAIAPPTIAAALRALADEIDGGAQPGAEGASFDDEEIPF